MSALAARSPEWHDERRLGVGSSDAAAIVGVSRFRRPIDVWGEKVGLAEPSPDSPVMEWGRRLEPVIADAAAERLGLTFRRRAKLVRYREWPIAFAHLDRVGLACALECKSSMTTRGWGEDGTSVSVAEAHTVMPPDVAVQVGHQLLVTGYPRVYVAALIGYRDFRLYEVLRDDAYQADLLSDEQDFWRLVETRTPPEPDGSDAYAAYLRRRYPRDTGGPRPATPEEQLLGRRLLAVRADLARLVEQEKELANRLQAAIGEAGGIAGPGWRALWRSHERTAVRHKELAAELRGLLIEAGMPEEEMDALVAKHTRTTEVRPFLFDSDEEGD